MRKNPVLALDVGDVRVGLALSDLSGMLASPYKTVLRAKGTAQKEILKLVKEHGIRVIVVGLPLDESNQRTKQCLSIENFCRRLERRIPAKFVFVDEYSSTLEASEIKRARHESRNKKSSKSDLDALSAAVLLQSYLDGKAT